MYTFRRKYWKIYNLFISNKERNFKIGKNVEKIIKKLYPEDYNSLTVQGLGQGHFQILLMISQKVFIKLNLNKDMMMRSVKLEELKSKIASVFLNTQVKYIN